MIPSSFSMGERFTLKLDGAELKETTFIKIKKKLNARFSKTFNIMFFYPINASDIYCYRFPENTQSYVS